MKYGAISAGLAIAALTFACDSVYAEPLGGTRFLPERAFEWFDAEPADAVALTHSAISNDVTGIARVCGTLGLTSVEEVERWHRLGIPVLAKLPGEAPRKEAVSAFLIGFDGVVAPDGEEVRYGKADVAALARMNELARKVCDLQDRDGMRLEGRMGLFQLESVDAVRDDPDLTRLHAYARIRRLAAFAKEPEGIDCVLELPPRPELVPQKPPTKNRLGPSPSEIDAALKDRSHFLKYDEAVRPWERLLEISEEEALIGFPDAGAPSCSWRDAKSERMFVERRLELVRRKFSSAAEGMRCEPGAKAKPPKVLSEGDAERRRVYDLIPEMDLLPETVIRLRVAYLLDRLQGREIAPLPPEEKTVELEIEIEGLSF